MRALELLGGLLIALAIGIGTFKLVGMMVLGAMKQQQEKHDGQQNDDS